MMGFYFIEFDEIITKQGDSTQKTFEWYIMKKY